jgi:zinc transporter
MSGHIIHAYRFDEGAATNVVPHDISKHIKGAELAWVHLDAAHPDTKAWLNSELDYLDPYIVQALLEDETRPRLTEINGGLLLILRGVNLNPDAEPEDMVSIRLWIDKHRIISMQRRKLKAIQDMIHGFNSGKAPPDAGQFICTLIARLSERMEPVLSELSETTDNIEEDVLETTDIGLRKSITTVRKRAIMLRRYIAPQRDAIMQLRQLDMDWITHNHKRQITEVYNRTTRYLEDLDAIRERAQIVKDEIASSLSDRMNHNMYLLSVIAAIFLPLGFLTGLMGINLGGIPGADSNDGFLIFSLILLVVVALEVWVFRKMRWF